MLRIYPLACLLLVFICYPSSYALPTSQGDDATFNVEGIVLNSVTGKPIPRALVQLGLLPSPAVLTGPEGEFSFQHVPGGTLRFTATKPGYLSLREIAQTFSTKWVPVKPETKRVVIKLAPEAVITGTVLDKNEEPMEGLRVEILGSKIVHGHPVVSPVGTLMSGYYSFNPIQTGPDGSFRVPMLPAGKYYVSIKCEGKPQCNPPDAGKSKERSGYPPVTYYPDVVDFEAATAIEVSAGQHVALPFILKRVPVYSVSGTIGGIQAFKFVNPPILADTRGQIVTSAELDRKTGTFIFKAVPAGNYKVLLDAFSDGQQLSTQSKLTVDGPLTGISLAFGSPHEIPVIVHKELSKPPSNTGHCAVSGVDGKSKDVDCADIEALTLQLEVADSDRTVGSVSIKLKQGSPSQGLSHVMPGRYYVVPQSSMMGGYLASLRCGGVDLLRDELVVPEEGGMPPIEAVFRDDWAAVNIQMHSDVSEPYGIAVFISKLPGRQPIVLDMQPARERDYANIPPGEYTVFIVDTDQLSLSDEVNIAEFTAKGTSVTLTANTTTALTLDLIHGGE